MIFINDLISVYVLFCLSSHFAKFLSLSLSPFAVFIAYLLIIKVLKLVKVDLFSFDKLGLCFLILSMSLLFLFFGVVVFWVAFPSFFTGLYPIEPFAPLAYLGLLFANFFSVLYSVNLLNSLFCHFLSSEKSSLCSLFLLWLALVFSSLPILSWVLTFLYVWLMAAVAMFSLPLPWYFISIPLAVCFAIWLDMPSKRYTRSDKLAFSFRIFHYFIILLELILCLCFLCILVDSFSSDLEGYYVLFNGVSIFNFFPFSVFLFIFIAHFVIVLLNTPVVFCFLEFLLSSLSKLLHYIYSFYSSFVRSSYMFWLVAPLVSVALVCLFSDHLVSFLHMVFLHFGEYFSATGLLFSLFR